MKKLRRIAATGALMLSWLAANAFEVLEIPTTNLPETAHVTVAVPKGYDGIVARRYPVVYLLNGHGGDHTSWSKIINIDSLATAHGVILVCPDGMNSWYWDAPADTAMRMETYIISDLVPWVDRHFRTRHGAIQRAVTGLSMGGHGALWLALRHPDVFGNAGSTSGGVDFRPWPKSWNIPDRLGPKATNGAVWDSHTVMSLIDLPSARQVNMIIDCGTEDLFYKVNCRLHRELERRGIRHEFRTSPGAHTPQYWHKSIGPQLDFFESNFKKAYQKR